MLILFSTSKSVIVETMSLAEFLLIFNSNVVSLVIEFIISGLYSVMAVIAELLSYTSKL